MINVRKRLFSASLLALAVASIVSCGTSTQPNWAAQHVASRNQAVIASNKRTFLFKPFHKYDRRLNLEMVRVSNDGTLVVRSEFGFESLALGQPVAFGGDILKLLDSDPNAQTAVLQSWPRL